ncbi:hypothetical protein Lser_V15G26856 [Lactuca serriola]
MVMLIEQSEQSTAPSNLEKIEKSQRSIYGQSDRIMHNIQLKKLMNVYSDRHKETPDKLMPNLAASDAVKCNGTQKGDVAVSHENLIANVTVGSPEINFYPFDVFDKLWLKHPLEVEEEHTYVFNFFRWFGNFNWDLIHTIRHMQRGRV